MTLPRPVTTGTLAKTPLAHLFVYALERQLTGSFELACTSGETATITVENGKVAKVRTSKAVAYLGPLLYEMGVIDDVQLNASLVDLASKRALHGHILLERGWITQEMLGAALREQTLRKLAHLFALSPDTMFSFHPETDLLADYGERLTAIDPFPAIWRGIRENPSEDHVRHVVKRIGASACRLTANAELARFDLQGDEQTAADALRLSPMTVAQFAASEAFGQRRAELLLYCMLITKQVELVSADLAEGAPRSSKRGGAEDRPISFVLQAATPVSVPPSSQPSSNVPRSSTRPVRASDTATHATSRPPSRAASAHASSRPAPASHAASGTPTLKSAKAPSTRPKPLSSRPPKTLSSRPPRTTDESSVRIAEEITARRQMIRTRANVIQHEDALQRLGLARGASIAQIENAFNELRAVWDPTTLPYPLDDVRDECWIVLSAMAEGHAYLLENARATLHDPDVADLAATGTTHPIDAAKAYLARNDAERAEQIARRTLKADPKSGPALALVAWLEAMKPEHQSDHATRIRIGMLDRAIDADGSFEDAFYWRGQLHKRMHNDAAALSDFRHVLDLNDRHAEAIREVRVSEMRMRKGAPRTLTPPAGTPARTASGPNRTART